MFGNLLGGLLGPILAPVVPISAEVKGLLLNALDAVHSVGVVLINALIGA